MAPAAAAAAAWAPGLGPARTTARRPCTGGASPAAGSSTGADVRSSPAGGRPAEHGGARHRHVRHGQARARDGLRVRHRRHRQRAGRRPGGADRPQRVRPRALVPGRGDDERAEVERSLHRPGLRRLGEAGVRRVDGDQRDPLVIGGVAVEVRVDDVLEALQQLVRAAELLGSGQAHEAAAGAHAHDPRANAEPGELVGQGLPAGLAAAGRRRVVAVDGVVAAVDARARAAAEQRDHRGVVGRGDPGRIADGDGSGDGRVEAAVGAQAHAQALQAGQVLGVDGGGEAVPGALEGHDVAGLHAAGVQRRQQGPRLLLERGDVAALGPRRHACASSQLARAGRGSSTSTRSRRPAASAGERPS